MRAAKMLAAASILVLTSLSTTQGQPARPEEKLQIELASGVSYGEPVLLRAKVINPGPRTGIPRLPRVTGLRITGPGRPSHSNYTQIVDGQITSQKSVTYTFAIDPDPGRTGTFVIGPAVAKRAGGADLVSDRVRLAVQKEPPLGIKIRCEVVPASGTTGAPFRVIYTVYYPKRRARGGTPSLRALSLPILEHGDFKWTSVPSIPNVRHDTMRVGDQKLIYQNSFAVLDNRAGYETLVFAFDVIPRKAGDYELGKASATMKLPTGKKVLGRDVFGRRVQVPELLSRSGTSDSVVYHVRDLPRQGKPAGFTGAVGRYTITVSTPDTRVRAFDPIQLEITVKGTGLLEDLSAPDWTQIASLTKNFRVNRDVDAGEIVEDTKIFRQVIRARRDDVTEIPALPFPHYDPWARKYKNALSKPIPIEVSAVRTIGSESAIGPNRPGAKDTSASTSSTNFIVEESGIPPNFTEVGASLPSLVSHRRLLEAPFLLCLAAPPLAFVGLLLVRRSRRRDPALLAKGRALSTARAALARAGGDSEAVSTEAVSTAYQDFFRDRFAMPPGEITPEQLRAVLSKNDAETGLVDRAVDCLEILLAGRFGAAAKSGDELARTAVKVIAEIDRC
jgi:hypothetical protein